MPNQPPFRVVIAGAGVAGLEAALALRELAADRVAITLISPDAEFVYRPMRVREPFAFGAARHYPLADIARDIGAELKEDAFARLDADHNLVYSESGDEISFDALLLAIGARPQQRFPHALTLDDRRLDDQLHGLIQDIEAGYLHKLAFLIPTQMAWPLPIYELALMTARRAWDMNVDLSVTIVTPEDAPLAVFGGAASDAVRKLLEEQRILTITSAHPETPSTGRVSIHPGSRELRVDRVLALPQLGGPPTPGVPKKEPGAFVPVDRQGRVAGLERVWAAGDAVDFAIKHGGISSQQADVAAASISALTGAPVEISEFHPVITGMLLGGRRPLYMRAHITGGHGTSSEVSEQPLWSPATKIAAKYLSPYLKKRDGATVG